MGQAFSPAASLAAVPTGALQLHSARSCPGAAGCAVHSRSARVPRVPEIAHSTCGHTADGDEWTYTTPRVLPRVLTADLRCSTRIVFPYVLLRAKCQTPFCPGTLHFGHTNLTTRTSAHWAPPHNAG